MVRRSRKRGPHLTTGLLLIATGLAFLLDRAGVFDIQKYWKAWPVLLIALGLGRLVTPGDDRESRGWGLMMILQGFVFFAIVYGWFGFTWQNAWPLLIMILGLGFTIEALLGRSRTEGAPEENPHA